MFPLPLLFTLVATEPSPERIPVEVAEATFISLLKESQRSSERTLCLVVDGENPSNELDALVAVASVPLVPGSECYYKQLPNRREVALTRSGAPAEFLSLSKFERRSPSIVAVAYEYRAGSWTGTGSVLTLHLEDGAWQAQPQVGYNWVE